MRDDEYEKYRIKEIPHRFEVDKAIQDNGNKISLIVLLIIPNEIRSSVRRLQ